MGRGNPAQLVALNGSSVVLKDINDEIVANGMKKIEALTSEGVSKEVIARTEAEAALRNITPTSEWEPLVGADLVIEAVVEREDVKREVFRQLAERLKHGPVLASNTSGAVGGATGGSGPAPRARRRAALLQPRSPDATGGSGSRAINR